MAEEIRSAQIGKKAGNASRVSVLDGYRGIACLLVVFYHQAQNIGIWPFKLWGFTGVHLFFILSGFLLGRPYIRALLYKTAFPSAKEFYLRRFVRIYPPYIIAMLTFVALRVATKSNVPNAENIGTHFALIFNYFDKHFFFSINPVLWSLAIEAQFYIILPVFALVCRKAGFGALQSIALLFGFGVVARSCEVFFFAPTHNIAVDVRFVSIFSFLDLFAFGMLLVLIQEKMRTSNGNGVPSPFYLKTAPLVFGGLALTVLANLWCSLSAQGDWLTSPNATFSILFPVLLCAGFTCLLGASVLDGWAERVFSWKPLVLLGAVSYSIYLYHIGVQVVVGSILPRITGPMYWGAAALSSAFISLPLVLLLSFIMYRLVEKPCLDWLERRKTSLPIASTPQNQIV